MPITWTLPKAAEPAVLRLAHLIALKIRPGDTLALSGDLGAGKTTFARALIRAVLGEIDAEVPSPTFALVQTYDAPRLSLAHVDLYRLADESEALELGISELAERGAVIIEWPERSPSLLGPDRLDIALAESNDADNRDVTVTAHGTWVARLGRLQEIAAFLARIGIAPDAPVSYLQGDASARAYARTLRDGVPVILVDWPPQPDGPPIKNGLPYSRIAHLAEGTAAFESVGGLLASAGLVVPETFAADHARGLMLIADLGDRVFGVEIGKGTDQETMWAAGTETLVAMRVLDEGRVREWNGSTGRAAPVGDYDRGAYEIETTLVPDWYWPLVKGGPIPGDVRAAFEAAWAPVIDRLCADASRGLCLRDYHSPNLLHMPERGGAAHNQVGIIDYQDALIGHPAFDLVSLLQDARLDVSPGIEDRLYARYVAAVQAREPDFDAAAFRFAYAALGAQRNTKILGIFARLWTRDGKPHYLRHIPRIWRYLERGLAHPDLKPVAQWYDAHFPATVRREAPRA
ncbi:MAG: tRNA (adenosine(37)-N6)-threonylcarbamoyltransferase complex ATPase subunit type 1 TsaE [Hyphomicrobium sp. 32-62-53]|nr:MAG: tRNA (adenosine(37)-N6)-threonylcarbamoyltransferase complex ATPase subunit type 1 TsaE [Hyphomicrobium sp. 32-62-53]